MLNEAPPDRARAREIGRARAVCRFVRSQAFDETRRNHLCILGQGCEAMLASLDKLARLEAADARIFYAVSINVFFLKGSAARVSS
jgi:hypothetical protein